MQQEERRRIARPGLPIEDGKPVDLCCAIESRMFHEVVPSGRPLRQRQRNTSHQGHARRRPELTPTTQRMDRHGSPAPAEGGVHLGRRRDLRRRSILDARMADLRLDLHLWVTRAPPLAQPGRPAAAAITRARRSRSPPVSQLASSVGRASPAPRSRRARLPSVSTGCRALGGFSLLLSARRRDRACCLRSPSPPACP